MNPFGFAMAPDAAVSYFRVMLANLSTVREVDPNGNFSFS